MLLCEVFTPELIKIELEAEDKDEVFEELTNHYCQIKKSNAREEILKAIWERESKMSTGIKKGIAVPHGKTTTLEHVIGILGISKKGIDYDALDGQPVYLIFMILEPKTENEKNLRLLKRLAELLNNHQFYSEMLVQKDPQSANQILKKYEDIYLATE